MRVHDPFARVRGLASETQAACLRLEIESCAGGLQLAHASGSFLDEHLYGGGIAQCRARGERVAPMQLGGIAGAEGRRDAALRVRRGAVEERTFRQQQNVAVLRRAPRRVQSRHAGSNDKEPRPKSINGHLSKYLKIGKEFTAESALRGSCF
jgi:hypothetical protein